ncbi:30S ribosomal protein S8 [archaeon]|nr:30S ribosomal protein S8 [archaeon]MBT4272466.1 30S ribosomal protein S8 [archaeon]MBT4460564.1 30S ribosomal protein S8 [archaeon]MBT4857846.1 30S ribosomal protein S8 [archaeon]MBT5423139.1 30S ribosomal protein S8 [archaeon]
MSLNDPLANALSHIMIEDKKGKKVITLKNNSKIIREVLTLLRENKYLGDFKIIEDGKAGTIEVNLIGAINKTGVVKPRYSVKLDGYEKFEKRFLLAYGFGFLIVSTNQGIMTQEKAIEMKLGGRLLAYVY